MAEQLGQPRRVGGGQCAEKATDRIGPGALFGDEIEAPALTPGHDFTDLGPGKMRGIDHRITVTIAVQKIIA
jgi:hypothetical protein